MSDAAPDKFTHELAKSQPDEPTRLSLITPSPNPATNLLIADIVVRGASRLFRRKVEREVAKKSYVRKEGEDAKAESLVGGRSVLTTLGLYYVSKVATRSPVGLGVVASGLALKTLYDRGKARQRRLGKRRGKK